MTLCRVAVHPIKVMPECMNTEWCTSFLFGFPVPCQGRVRLHKLVALLVENYVQDFDGDFSGCRWFRPS